MNYKSMNAMANSFSISKEVADSLSAIWIRITDNKIMKFDKAFTWNR